MSEEPKSVTVVELDDLIGAYLDQQDILDKKEEALKEENKIQAALEAKIVTYMKELERSDYQSEIGKAKITEKWRVKLPENDAEKLKLLAHLKERGIYEKYVTVNANALNALYFADEDAAKREGKGLDFSMPGISPPSLFEKAKISRLKEKN